MADNVTLPPTGTSGTDSPVVATEVIGAAHYQKLKLIDATAGSTTPVGTAANPLKVDASATTQPVSAASLPLPSGAATLAGQTQPGVDIGDVTINNAAGAAAVNVQDGGNSLTVDGTVFAARTTASGSITGAGQAVTITLSTSASVVGCYISGSYSGTLAFEATIDGTNWFSHLTQSDSLGSFATAPSPSTGAFVSAVAGFTGFRVSASAWVSGTATITLVDSLGSRVASLAPGTAIAATVSINQASAGTNNNVNVDTTTGAGATIGATTDVAITSDANSTISGKLRGLVKMFADMWDSSNHGLKVVQATATNLKVDASGVAVPVTDNAGSLTVDNANLDVALSTLATASAQATGNSSLSTIAGKDFATSAKQDTGNTSLASIKTDLDPLVTAAAGGYVRQDSTATIAKESGGNLATIATNSALAATASKQDTGNTSLTTIATDVAPLITAQGAASTSVTGPMVQGLVTATPLANTVATIQPFSMLPDGSLRVTTDDGTARRQQELTLLEQHMAAAAGLLASESENSGRAGLELR